MNHSHKENIEKIRAACIAAHNGRGAVEVGAVEIDYGRPVRLADVLLAIGNTETVLGVRENGTFMQYEPHEWRSNKKLIYWNLRNDDLTAQSPETIQFIATLLLT